MINFIQYPNLTKVVIPGDIKLSDTMISSYDTFMNMSNLREVIMHKNVVKFIKTYGNWQYWKISILYKFERTSDVWY